MATQLDRAAVAALTGLRVGTLDTYQRDGRMPKADGYTGRTPWWWQGTITKWDAKRRKGSGKPPGSKNRPKVTADRPKVEAPAG